MKAVVHEEYRRGAEQHWWFRARREVFTRLLDARVPLPRRARILELGPGSGVNLPVLAPRGRVTVLDADLGSLRACRDAAAASDAGVTAVRGDAAEPPLAGGAFDLLCALDVLEHLADDLAALRSWRRLLRPGGHLLLTVPALPLLWGRQDVLSGHHRRYRRRELRQRLVAAGWTIERLTYFNTLLLPPILLVRLAMRPFLGRATRGGSDFGAPTFGLGSLLHRVFACEARWLPRHDLPLGVSLLALARVGSRSTPCGTR